MQHACRPLMSADYPTPRAFVERIGQGARQWDKMLVDLKIGALLAPPRRDHYVHSPEGVGSGHRASAGAAGRC